MAIWDKLPPEERRKHIQARLTPGRVLLLHCDFTTPPKDKFLVLVAVEPEPLFFVINSEVSEFIRRRNHLMQCQVEIGHEEHSFLRHHSFVDCTTAHRIALRDIYEQIERDIGRLKDEASQQIREQIVAAVKFAKTLSAKHKTEILSALVWSR